MTMIFSFAVLKGGVGKSTLNINVAYGLATMKKKVLLVDADPQSNVAIYLDTSAKSTFANVLHKEKIESDDIIRINKSFHVIPGSHELSIFNIQQKRLPFKIVADILQPLRKKYDVIIIDIAPGITSINASVLSALDCYAVPMIPGALSLQGLKDFEYQIKVIRGQPMKPMGVVFNRFDPRRNIDRTTRKILHNDYNIFHSFIRQNVKFEEAAASGKPIIEYDPKSNGAIDIMKLTEELRKKLNKYNK
jgi:chromosome partitioning protein